MSWSVVPVHQKVVGSVPVRVLTGDSRLMLLSHMFLSLSLPHLHSLSVPSSLSKINKDVLR